MMNKNVRGLIALAVVTALSFGVIAGSRALSKDAGVSAENGNTQVLEELDVADVENIERAAKTSDGFEVEVKEKGYGGDIHMKVKFDESKNTVMGLEIISQTETEGVGSKITEDSFLQQFQNMTAPVYVPGMSTGSEEQKKPGQDLEGATLQDGSYEARTAEPDSNGFIDVVKITVNGGKITEASWDAVMEDGTSKSEMSENGQYTMTEDGLTWKKQAEALSKALVDNQSLSIFTMDDQGKTDAVSGVSISIGGFVTLAEDCLRQAAGIEKEDKPEESMEGTQIDAISGATVSSTAVAKGINRAYEFLHSVK